VVYRATRRIDSSMELEVSESGYVNDSSRLNALDGHPVVYLVVGSPGLFGDGVDEGRAPQLNLSTSFYYAGSSFVETSSSRTVGVI
jgi:hypothetical protein